VTDLLEETICYAKLSDEIQKVCNKREYQLIEKLTWDTYISIKATLPKDIQLWLRATKERPPIAHLEGGSSFSIGDWNPS
jgi:dihydroneopterin aldolase